MKKNKEELLKLLHKETKIKNKAEIEIENCKLEIERLQKVIKQTESFVKIQEKIINNITNDLKESE